MAKIRKIYDQTIKPDGSKTTIYPITSTRAVYTPEGETLDSYLKDGYFHGADLAGYKVVYELSELPLEETPFGYLMDCNLYVWVGTNGDTLDGKYQNCGPFKGPRGYDGHDGRDGRDGQVGPRGIQGPQGSAGLTGPRGLKGDKGDTGVTLGQVALTTDLDETETGKALDASAMQTIPSMVDAEEEIEEVPSNYYTRTQVDALLDNQRLLREQKEASQDAEISNFENTIRDVVNSYKPVEVYGNVTNVPDGEDLTTVNGRLKFANRPNLNGMGYYILRRDKSFEEQVVHPNTIYEIRYDFILSENITIPENSTLKFNGGSVSGAYALIGQNTKILASKNQIFSGVGITGTWNVPCIYSVWFANITNNNEIKKLFALTNAEVENTVFVEQGNYRISVSAENQTVINLNSNTNVILNGTITLDSNGYDAYKVFYINYCSNVTISGSGSIVGDKDTHTGITGEQGNGIYVSGSRNVRISGLSITKCWGDGIYIGAAKNYDIKVEGCEIYNCRRQGISLTNFSRAEITDCYIHDISGHDPQYCIDIEPNQADGYYAELCRISNCKFVNEKGCIQVLAVSTEHNASYITIDSCYIESTSTEKFALNLNTFGENININNCFITGYLYNYERAADGKNPKLSYVSNTITTNYMYNQHARFVNNIITTKGNGIMRGTFRDNLIKINLDADEKVCFRGIPILVNNRIQVVYTEDNYEAFFEFAGNNLSIGEFEDNIIMFPTDNQELLCSKFTDDAPSWTKPLIQDVMMRSRNRSNCTLLHLDSNIKLSTKNNLPAVTNQYFRTNNPVIGERLFDINLGKEIVYDGTNWVDASGTTV